MPLTNITEVENWENVGKEWSDFDPNDRTRSYFLGSSLRCKVSSKLNEKICDSIGEMTDRQTDGGGFIICYNTIAMGQINT